MKKIISQGKQLLTASQNSILSAATIIMVMIVASRILGLVRQRVLAHFFVPEELSLFFAAFRLPDLVFEVLVFGTFTSAFIPVFTKAIKKDDHQAWVVAGKVVNLGLIFFVFFAILFGFLAHPLYRLVTPGFDPQDIARVAGLARILFAAQGFFVVSYILTGVLESLRRFLVPALAPLFYNLGIIFGTIFLTPVFGLTAPAIGVVIGASLHFAVQLPLAFKLGFRFVPSLKPDQEVRKIGRLALPRVVDLSFQQVVKTVELFLASLISQPAYTYFTFANTLQLLPVSLFGTSLAKAALPTLARLEDERKEFKKTFFKTFYQIFFLVLPMAMILIVLRIPIVRLVYGTDIFDWQATIQTGLVLTAFAVGIPFQAGIALLARAFYALHDTKTPVIVSLISMCLIVIGDLTLVLVFSQPAWALAAAFTFGTGIQAISLYFLLIKRINGISVFKAFLPIAKSLVASIISGLVMFSILKFFDRSVWIKKLSFLKAIDISQAIPFEKFVLDTRYTINLLILTATVSLIGMTVYLLISFLFKSEELKTFLNIIKTRTFKLPAKKSEPITSNFTDSTT